ncbi:MAG: M28 family peptidase [Cyclobacteriaceae bacterium]|nr:M28 family peptidase [Cyclobacteriaceae bacterium]
MLPMLMRQSFTLLCCFIFLVISCKTDSDKKNTAATEKPLKNVQVPAFNSDSAYAFIKKQVDFGPRIPNTNAHRQAADYFVALLKQFGAEVTVQEFTATTYDQQKLALRNIIASFYPEQPKRILLAAHWDTRPFSDKDAEKPRGYFDGANDGASGVGVLLEIARALHTAAPPAVGVDFILFDGEDWGFDQATAETLYGKQVDYPLPKNLLSWWCLGSQYWSKNKHKPNYSAYFGILLDMVGGQNSVFVKEGYSMEYAPGIVNKVWSAAMRLGYGNIFINKTEGSITDDHVFVNEFAKIPMINIISYDPELGFFGDFHHTRKDNMELISKERLQAVGHTLLHVIYQE